VSAASLTLEVHELALLIPEMTEAEYVDLVTSIHENGLQHPIVTYEGKVLDGRHRQRACVDAQVEPRYVEYEGDSPVAFVISSNLHRRHLKPSQLAMVAADALPAFEEEARRRQGQRTDLHPTSAPNGAQVSAERATDHAAALTGASPRNVQRAKRIQEIAADEQQPPEVRERAREIEAEVRAGQATVTAGEEELRSMTAEPSTTPDPKPLTGRDATRANAQKRKLIEAVSTLNGLAIGLDSLDVDRARAALEPEELDEWDRLLGNALARFRQLRTDLRKDRS